MSTFTVVHCVHFYGGALCPLLRWCTIESRSLHCSVEYIHLYNSAGCIHLYCILLYCSVRYITIRLTALWSISLYQAYCIVGYITLLDICIVEYITLSDLLHCRVYHFIRYLHCWVYHFIRLLHCEYISCLPDRLWFIFMLAVTGSGFFLGIQVYCTLF